ncbi:thermospermine synthase ACAULIS5-like [Senna tora]|uniref:Thermospermine synthase ACAULIS5-like n=1 Tax=Senna tora TaxID=362788 RepID=A0A834WC17_9FABA|nr:thermospermine synthase ACAULIS5-like [Senna tora]
MGGGDGCTAREVLKHRNIQKVILCDIDEDVVLLLKMTQNVNWWDARDDQRLQLIFQDAKGALENTEEKFDVIVGDVGDQPIELGHPNHLYTKSFYENVVKPKLNPNGIFAGPAGVLSHKDKFSPVYNTLKQVFTYVGAYTAHVPSYADTCGWVMASDEELRVDDEELNTRIGERIDGELFYLDGPCIVASTILNKTLKTSLMNETKVITEDS